MAFRPYERSLPDIAADLLDQFPTLLRQEARLARAEISEKLTSMGRGIGMIVGGAVLLIPALVVLLIAAVALLESEGFEPSVAALIVGGATLLIGIVLLMVGISRMKVSNLIPEKTIHQLQEDASVAKRQVRKDHAYQRAA